MRLIQLAVGPEKRARVVELLEDAELEFAITDETSSRGYGAVVSVPVETDEVEALLDDLRSIGIERDGYAVISDVEAVLSDALEERSEARESETGEPAASDRISRDELRARAAEMADLSSNYLVFTVISAVVATAGLLADSAAVVVGSMVIAPLLGPAVGASVGSIVNDDDLFREGTTAQVSGVVLAVASATAFAFLAKFTLLPHVELNSLQEVAARMNPGALSLVIALGSGAAGALSLSAGVTAPLVGVMIAAALIPPAAAIGLGIAYGNPVLAISATILVLVNVLSINFAIMAVLWARGYRPDHWFEARIARTATLKRIAVLFVGIVVLGSFLVVTTVDIQRNAQFERTVQDVVVESEVAVLSTEISYESRLFSRQPSRVTLHVVDDSPRTATDLQERIWQRTGQDPTIVIVREDADVDGSIRSGNGSISVPDPGRGDGSVV